MAKITYVKEVNCPYCASERVVKNGKRSGTQRFMCRACEKSFTDTGKVHGHKRSADQIGAAIRLFYSGTSYKQIAENMADMYDIPEPSKQTIYAWVRDYTDAAMGAMDDYKAHTGGHWVANEMLVDVGGEKFWNWNVMDRETRYILASHLTPFRDVKAAEAVMRKAANAASEPPESITTDKLRSYNRAVKKVFPQTKHVQSEGLAAEINNNLSERLQGTFRQRTKTLRGLESLETGQRYLDGWVITYNLFREHEGLDYKTPGQVAKVDAPFKEWADIVKRGTAPTVTVKPLTFNETRDVDMKSRPGVTFVSSSKRNKQSLSLPAKPKEKRRPKGRHPYARRGEKVGSR